LRDFSKGEQTERLDTPSNGKNQSPTKEPSSACAGMSSHIIHSVHFYERDEALIQRLGTITLAAFDAGKPALLIVTEEHKQQLSTFFRKRGVDPYAMERRGLLIALDAEAVLRKFFRRGKLNPQIFRLAIGRLLDSVTDSTGETVKGMMAFGEMVAILWKEGNKDAALELERLWNGMLEEHDFQLHCAYPKDLFGPAHSAEIQSICELHSISFGFAQAAA
jgi:hypothetical protein